MLVAAMNPWPREYRSDPRRACSCTLLPVEKYLSKISGPLLDRIDLYVEVPAAVVEDLQGRCPRSPTHEIVHNISMIVLPETKSGAPGLKLPSAPRMVRQSAYGATTSADITFLTLSRSVGTT
jgi:hypothetical protein